MRTYASKRWKQRLGFCAADGCRKRAGFVGTVRGYDEDGSESGEPVTVRWCGPHAKEVYEGLAPEADEIIATVTREERWK